MRKSDPLRLLILVCALGSGIARADPPAPVPAAQPGDAGDLRTQSDAFLPQREIDLIQIFTQARKRYVAGKAGTRARDVRMDMQVSVVDFMRNGQTASDWVGVVKGRGTDKDGSVWLTMEIAEGITVSTWLTQVTDTDQHTLIPPYSPLYDVAKKARIGARAVFSAQILGSALAGDDEMISRPQLIARFTALRVAQ